MTIKTTSLKLDEDIHIAFKARCVMNRVQMGDVMNNLMKEYVGAWVK